MNKWFKRFLIAVTLVSILILISSPAFTTCSSNGGTALVAKYTRKGLLKPGDLLLVEADPQLATNQSIYRLEQIHPPDPSTRKSISPNANRSAIRRRIAQDILDMDFKPTYSVSLVNGNTTNAPIVISERQIRGKVIYTFGR